jgi:hypothetical protein
LDRLFRRRSFTSSGLSGDADAKKIEVRRTDGPFDPALKQARNIRTVTPTLLAGPV